MRKAKVIYGLIFTIFPILFSAALLHASILFVSPHPDDDVITASGIIYSAVQRGEPVKIVFMTNGDLYGGAAHGYIREAEAVTGESVLGVTEDNLIFLGYPDGYLNTIYTRYRNSTDQLVTSNGISATYGNRGLGRTAYHTHRFGAPASYNMVNILTDLEDILSTYQPDQILVTSEYDLHPDHSTTYQLLRAALLSVNSHIPNYIPVIHTTIVHWDDVIWPDPIDPTSFFSPYPKLSSGGTTWTQTSLSWTDRESIKVPIPMQSIDYTANPKYRAISAHASQGGTSRFLGNFIHKDEIFWPENDLGRIQPPIANAGPDHTAQQGGLVHLDGSLSKDPNGDPLSFHWVQRSGIHVHLSDPAGSHPFFTAPTGLLQDAILTFELTVSDGHFSTIPDSVSVAIPASLIPGALMVTPAFAASGAPGGPLASSIAAYTLKNGGNTTINWSASAMQSWITLSSNSGSLAPGASTTLTVSINGNANSLAAGSYSDTVAFTNTTNRNGGTIQRVTLTISPNSFFVKAGGGQYTDISGNVYKADTDYSGGETASTIASIAGTPDGKLYQTEMYGNFAYSIPLANGNYNVTLKFAEIHWNASGRRIFNVSMQGQQVISNLDIYAKVGRNAACDITIPVSVANGALNIKFTSVVNYAKVSAIEVTPK